MIDDELSVQSDDEQKTSTTRPMSNYIRKTALTREKVREIMNRKKDAITHQFKLGPAPDCGEIQELVIEGTNVLKNEVDFAWSLPES